MAMREGSNTTRFRVLFCLRVSPPATGQLDLPLPRPCSKQGLISRPIHRYGCLSEYMESHFLEDSLADRSRARKKYSDRQRGPICLFACLDTLALVPEYVLYSMYHVPVMRPRPVNRCEHISPLPLEYSHRREYIPLEISLAVLSPAKPLATHLKRKSQEEQQC